ncbi:hypothetical protein [Spirosoma rhododendri]|uniref:Uncharacterized protein n=1 Tax=Spirosoma rhododendri TaxID=2728024 RepID=A0A7L5DN78_9BACT|nr:hypothetical protein [Spirosoma rhododendri]QJD78663.1 hypothetical protein HH216_09660 [Spirosoma rhododendri]
MHDMLHGVAAEGDFVCRQPERVSTQKIYPYRSAGKAAELVSPGELRIPTRT